MRGLKVHNRAGKEVLRKRKGTKREKKRMGAGGDWYYRMYKAGLFWDHKGKFSPKVSSSPLSSSSAVGLPSAYSVLCLYMVYGTCCHADFGSA